MDIAAALVFAILFGPPFVLLLVHVWRDLRGARRNQRGLCYACAKPVDSFNADWIFHYRGGAYLYCGSCHIRHTLWLNIAAVIAAAVMVAVGVLLLLTRH